MLSLKLFNSVLIPDNASQREDLRLGLTLPYGIILQPKVAGLPAFEIHDIITYYYDLTLSAEDMNKTFHKSWEKIKNENSSREELAVEQMLHYFTTYGLESLGLYSDNMIYIPQEVLEVPDIKQLPLVVVKGMTRDEMVQKCLGLLESGIALKEETVTDVLTLLDELEYVFVSVDNIKNKEAKMQICLKYNILPTNNTEFLRLLIFSAIQQSLVITNTQTLTAIERSGADISKLCYQYGLDKLSESFLRYKQLFLAFKAANPYNKKVVNRLRKLAKKNHKPMPVDYLNSLTSMKEIHIDILVEELDKVNHFRKIRLLYALHDRMQGLESFLYKIRNGKTFIKEVKPSEGVNYTDLYQFIYNHLVKSLGLAGKKVKYPKGIEYVLPTTEKQFIGNVPSGTYMDIDSDAIVGIYWEEAGGARDIDLSSVALHKVGWNASYYNSNQTLMYSGDVTRAPEGASECLYVKKELETPCLVMANLFSGNENSKYKFFVGKEEVRNFERNYMVDPNNIIFQSESTLEQRQKVMGILIPREEGGVRFVLTDFNNGESRVSNVGGYVEKTREFLFHTNKNRISLRQLLTDAGCEFVEGEADIDLTLESLDKTTILDLFTIKQEVAV